MSRSPVTRTAHAAPAVSHDHATCVETLLDRARQSFGDKGLKLTGRK